MKRQLVYYDMGDRGKNGPLTELSSMGKADNKAQNNRRADKSASTFDPLEAALRKIHDRVLSEDIPTEFLDLLDKLDERAGGGKPS